MKRTAFIINVFILLVSYKVTLCQSLYPDTLWGPVTCYDFHSDKSNPEFEQSHEPGIRTGMVGSTLDKQMKPVLGPTPYMNQYIKYWYRA